MTQPHNPHQPYAPHRPGGGTTPPQPTPVWPAPSSDGVTAVVVALITAVLVLAIGAVTMVAILDNKPDNRTAAPAATGHGARPDPRTVTASTPIDGCLIGAWKQTFREADIDMATLTDKRRIGTVHVTGKQQRWIINADGSAVEENPGNSYTGTTSDGRRITIMFYGTFAWKITTNAGVASLDRVRGSVRVWIYLDVEEIDRVELEPRHTSFPYTCDSGLWRTTGPGPNDITRYERTQ